MYRTAQGPSQFYPGQHGFVKWLQLQMIELQCMANVPLTKYLPKTINPFERIFAMWTIFTTNESGIHSALCVEGVKLIFLNARSNGRTNKSQEAQKSNHCRDEDGTDRNWSYIIRELPLQQIDWQVGVCKRTKYDIQWYVYRPDVDSIVPRQDIPQHFIVRYLRKMNRPRARKRQNIFQTPTQ